MQTSFKFTKLKVIYAYKCVEGEGVWLMRKYTPSSLSWDVCKFCLDIEGVDLHLLQASLKDFREKKHFSLISLKQQVEIHWDNG